MKFTPGLVEQSGAALITGLIFLVILTLLGVSAMRTSTLEERIASNTRDRNVALQSAEITLRDAEYDVMCKNAAHTGACTRTIPISGRTGFDESCTNGLCYKAFPPGFTTPVWQTFSLSAAPSVEYGTHTDATSIPGLAAQPRYLIEVFRKWLPGEGSWRNYYQLTTRAVGANSNTHVFLQEVFAP